MKAEEKKLTSIPQAIGLFMIFKALFYRNSFDGIEFEPTAFNSYIQFAESASFYVFMLVGIALCLSRRFIFYYLAYASAAFTLFGSIYTLAPGKENLSHTIALVIAHLGLCFALCWSQIMIKKLLIKQAKINDSK